MKALSSGVAEPCSQSLERTRPRPVVRIAAMIREWYRRHHSRYELAWLDSHMLRDIGLSHAEAEHEINKPFWRN